MLAKVAQEKGRDVVRSQVIEVLGDLEQELKRLEREKGVLKGVYRGHPAVRTKLTLPGFRDGAYRVSWYDDTTAEKILENTVNGPVAVLETPAFREHLAFTVTRSTRPGTTDEPPRWPRSDRRPDRH